MTPATGAATSEGCPWLAALTDGMQRGKHVILYGNVADHFSTEQAGSGAAEYQPLIPALLRHLSKYVGYELVQHYNVVDGFKAAQSSMEGLFERIVAKASRPGGGPAPAAPVGSSGGLATSRPGGAPASPLAMGGMQPAAPATAPRSAGERLEADLASIRQALAQQETAVAIVVSFADQLFGDAQHPTEAELRRLVNLKKAILDAQPMPPSHPLFGLRNILILVAGHLERIPPWLYQDSPRQGSPQVALVKVELPDAAARNRFLASMLPQFHGAVEATPQERANALEGMTLLTEGMTILDLEGMRRASIADSIPVTEHKRLVDFYRFGVQVDHWEQLSDQKVANADVELEKDVKGQTEAITALVRMLAAAKVGITMSPLVANAGRPKGVFFFVGPTGVGKTEMAKSLARLIFGDERQMLRFDMSEYRTKESAERFTGPPPGFVGYEAGGQLTNRVREERFGILLFDEIEKADPAVLNIFLQILEDGRLTDGKGQTAYFNQFVIIFTSNIGSSQLKFQDVNEADNLIPYDKVKLHFRTEVDRDFTERLNKPELLGRIGENIIAFDILRPRFIKEICLKLLASLSNAAERQRQCKLDFRDGTIVGMIQKMMQEERCARLGGRQIKKLLEEYVELPLNLWIFKNNPAAGQMLALSIADDGRTLLVNGSGAGPHG